MNNPYNVVYELEAALAKAEREIQRKQEKIDQLKSALRAMTKTYKSVAYAQWPPEMHFAAEVLEETK